jgi:hypothetical protein
MQNFDMLLLISAIMLIIPEAAQGGGVVGHTRVVLWDP